MSLAGLVVPSAARGASSVPRFHLRRAFVEVRRGRIENGAGLPACPPNWRAADRARQGSWVRRREGVRAETASRFLADRRCTRKQGQTSRQLQGGFMKRTVLVVVLVLALTFAFAASAFATTGKFFSYGENYYKWTGESDPPIPSTVVRRRTSSLASSAHVTPPRDSVSTLAPTPTTRARTPTTWPPPPSAACATPSTVRQETASSCCRPLTPRAPAATPAAPPSRPRSSRGPRQPGLAPTTTALSSNGPAGGGGGPHNDGARHLIEDGYWDGIGYSSGARATSTARATAASPAAATPPTRTARTARSTRSSPPSCCSTTRRQTTTEEYRARP